MYVCSSVHVYCVYLLYIILIGLELPTEQEFNKYIRDKVAPDWYYLGGQLQIPHEQLNIIRSDTSLDIRMCCTKTFQYWLQVDTTANWNKLIKALEDINHNVLAKTIKEEILQGMYVDIYA